VRGAWALSSALRARYQRYPYLVSPQFSNSDSYISSADSGPDVLGYWHGKEDIWTKLSMCARWSDKHFFCKSLFYGEVIWEHKKHLTPLPRPGSGPSPRPQPLLSALRASSLSPWSRSNWGPIVTVEPGPLKLCYATAFYISRNWVTITVQHFTVSC